MGAGSSRRALFRAHPDDRLDRLRAAEPPRPLALAARHLFQFTVTVAHAVYDPPEPVQVIG